MRSWLALLQIASCYTMTQKRRVSWYWESSKTQDRTNPDLYSRRLGLELSNEKMSLQERPRHYLFTEARSIKPYTHDCFQQYASRTLKVLFGKPCTLTLLRHSYISYMLAYASSASKTKKSLPATYVIRSRHKPSINSFTILTRIWSHYKRGPSHRQKGSESPTKRALTQRSESPTQSIWVTDRMGLSHWQKGAVSNEEFSKTPATVKILADRQSMPINSPRLWDLSAWPKFAGHETRSVRN